MTVPGLMPIWKCHSSQGGWVSQPFTCITDLCSRWAFPELWAMEHSPGHADVYVRKGVPCRIKFEKCCMFYFLAWVFSEDRISILMALRSWASKETGFTLLNPMLPLLTWPWTTMFAFQSLTSGCLSSGWEVQFFPVASLKAAQSLRSMSKWMFMRLLLCALIVPVYVRGSREFSHSHFKTTL